MGILIIEMITGEIPYRTVADVFHGKYPQLLEKDENSYKKISSQISNCCKLEPKERPTISQIISFFK